MLQGQSDAVRPVRKFFVGAFPAIADECNVVTKATLDHLVGELYSGVDVVWVLKSLQLENWLLINRWQPVPCEGVLVSAWSQHFSPPEKAIALLL